jgi:hypothetical protein
MVDIACAMSRGVIVGQYYPYIRSQDCMNACDTASYRAALQTGIPAVGQSGIEAKAHGLRPKTIHVTFTAGSPSQFFSF